MLRGEVVISEPARQGCISPGRRVVRVTYFYTVASSVCGPSVWNFLHVKLVAPRILRWVLDFWKTCAPLLQGLNSK